MKGACDTNELACSQDREDEWLPRHVLRSVCMLPDRQSTAALIGGTVGTGDDAYAHRFMDGGFTAGGETTPSTQHSCLGQRRLSVFPPVVEQEERHTR